VSDLSAFRDRYGVPAVGAALVTGEVVELDLLGERVRGGGDPVRAGDAWHIGSCGRSLTAALYARLVERGEAEWGARLPALFPDLGIDPRWSAVTVDDALAGAAGFQTDLSRDALAAAYDDARPLPLQRTAAAAAALARAPGRPGRSRDSNFGYVVVGAAIERITGTPYEHALVTHVLEPLGMASAGFGAPPAIRGHRARTPAPPDDPRADDPPIMGPAGRLHLALSDWARFQQVFLTAGGGFLAPATVERLRAAFRSQQGSSTFWVATALIDGDRGRAALVACNDGRRRLRAASAKLAARLLSYS
jgi:CubicO group peptidase (beta-lactamase class C family)